VNTACSSSKNGHCRPVSGSDVSFPWLIAINSTD
jgi:hypothetical protein